MNTNLVETPCGLMEYQEGMNLEQIQGRPMVGCESELIAEIEKLRGEVEKRNVLIGSLMAVAINAKDLLGNIPAFGDTIGVAINKAQIGVAHNCLRRTIAHVQTEMKWA